MQFCVLLIVLAILGVIHQAYSSSCVVSNKVDCGYAGIDESGCLAKGCCWSPAGTNSATPWCYYAGASSSGYSLSNFVETSYGYSGSLSLVGSGSDTYGPDLASLKLQVIFESESVFRIRITDKDSSRWEIPQSVISRPTAESVQKSLDTLYTFKYTENPFTFEVIRKSDGVSIFKNSNPIVFKDQYIELSTDFNSNAKTYGIGESTRTNHALQAGHTYTLWAADIPALSMGSNLYGAFPYYVQTLNGQAYGAMLMNSNGMDVSLQSSSLTFTTVGGMIDLYVFVGPSAMDVVRQYTSVVGRPTMMPFWSFGFHNCRYGYESLDQIKQVVSGYSNAGIPLETQWADIDYMQNYRDFSVDSTNFVASDMKSFIAQLHANNQHFVPIIDPGIMVYKGYDAYEDGLTNDIFIKDVQGNNYLGQVWPGPTYFPDFLHPKSTDYWTKQIKSFYDMVGSVDGLWIDMNEVSNFCNVDGNGQVCANDQANGCPAPGASQTDCCLSCHTVDSTNKLDFPPYAIHNTYGKLSTKTMAMSAVQYGNATVYNTHNIYGLTEQIATNAALTTITGKRPFILTRSSFLGTGKWSAKWTGDNGASWNDLKASIIGMMDFNMFGVPMIGADICGFIWDTTEELCARWIEVGAFYPFTRDHNTLGAAPQELYLWNTVTQAAKTALGMKYQLLNYYYSLFYESHTTGTPVIRPLWMNAPADSNLYNLDYQQFMVGSAILVSPVVDQGSTSVNAYFYKGNWYDFQTRQFFFTSTGESKSLYTPLTSVNVHMAGGNIVALQDAAMTTTAVRSTPYTILAALDESGSASGFLYRDDGEQVELTNYYTASFNIKVDSTTGTFTVAIDNHYTTNDSEVIGSLVVMGTPSLTGVKAPTLAKVNGVIIPSSEYSYDSSKHVLTFSNLAIDVKSVGSSLTITWQ